MKIPNYDTGDDVVTNFTQLHDFMPDRCFRMLICGPSGSGKNKHTYAYDSQSVVFRQNTPLC